MNQYKIHFNIQLVITVICALLAITYYGLMYVALLQAFMGIYQTITALIIFLFYKRYSSEIKKHLNIYAVVWLINAILTFLLFYGLNEDWDATRFQITIVMILFFVIPWSSAIYFITILKRLADWKALKQQDYLEYNFNQ